MIPGRIARLSHQSNESIIRELAGVDWVEKDGAGWRYSLRGDCHDCHSVDECLEEWMAIILGILSMYMNKWPRNYRNTQCNSPF